MGKVEPKANIINRERGNVFFALFGAVAVVGVIGAASMSIMRGPLTTMVEVNKKTQAESQMQLAGRMAIVQSAEQASSGDCDSDGYIEPIFPAAFGAPAPGGTLINGGALPNTIGASKTDPWGTEYGYCAWNAGSVDTGGGCAAGAPDLIAGSGTDLDTYPIITIVSAGADRTFSTNCRTFAAAAGGKLAVKAGGSDDIIMDFTYGEAQAFAGGLWKIQSGNPDVAEITKDLNVTGGATFSGASSASIFDLQNLAGSLRLPDESVTDGASSCNAANEGILRRNTGTSPPTVEICYDSGGSVWVWASVAAGASGVKKISDGDTEVEVNDGVPIITFDVNGTQEMSLSATTLDAGSLDITTTGTLGVDGNVTLGDAATDTVTITGLLTANEDVDFDKALDVQGNVILGDAATDTVTITGLLTANEDVDFDKALDVQGNVILGDAATDTVTITGLLTANEDVDFDKALDVQGNVILGDAATDTVTITGLLTANENVDFDKDLTVDGDLTVGGGDIVMNTNTSGNVLVADGTNFSSVAMSGDIAIDGAGATVIQNNAVQYDDLDVAGAGSGANCLKTNGTVMFVEACGSGGGGDGVGTDNLGDLNDVTDADAVGNILVNDGTDWHSVPPSNDIGIAANGSMTIQNLSVETSMIANLAVGTGKLADDAVTYAKMQDVSTDILLGRGTAGSGIVEEITLGTGLVLTGTVLSANGAGIAADSLDFDDFEDQMDLDASTDINAPSGQAYTLSITNEGTGNSFLVNDENAPGDTSPFVIDADGNVGIGIATPGVLLDIFGQDQTVRIGSDDSTGARNAAQIELVRSRGASVIVQDTDTLGGLHFNGEDGTGDYTLGAFIRGKVDGTPGDDIMPTELQFHVAGAGEAAAYGDTPEMTIRSNGNIGMGRDLPRTKLDVNGSIKLGDGGEACDTGETNFQGAIRYNATTDVIEYCKDNDVAADSWEALASTGSSVSALGDLSDVTDADGVGNILVNDGTDWHSVAPSNDIGIAANGSMTIQNTSVETGMLADDAVTYAKMQDVSATNRLLGRATAGAGIAEEITIGSSLSLTGTTLDVAASAASLWTDNTTHISREGFHVIDAAETTLPAALDDDGNRAFFFPDKGAFRSGGIFYSNDAWNNGNIAVYSFAHGFNSEASGTGSIAIGSNTTASDQYAIALGTQISSTQPWSVALGRLNYATGPAAFIGGGQQNTASGYNSMAFGNEVIAGDGIEQSFSDGDANLGKGNYSVAFGLGKPSSGGGNRPQVRGNKSFGIFFGDQASSEVTQEQVLALVGGKLLIDDVDGGTDTNQGCIRYNDTANQMEYSNNCESGTPTWSALGGAAALWTDNTTHISREGFHILDTGLAAGSTTAGLDGNGTYAFYDPDKGVMRGGRISSNLDGWEDINIGDQSFSWGVNNTSSGNMSTTFGFGANAISTGSFASGFNSYSRGDYAHAFGDHVSANGHASFATNRSSRASGYASSAFGSTVKVGDSATPGTSVNKATANLGHFSVGFGLGEASGFAADWPNVIANESFGIFFGDQTDSTVTQENVLALVGGKLLIDDVDGGTDTNQGCIRYNDTANQMEFANDCEAVSPAWTAMGGGAGSIADDSLDFDKFKDAMALDASTSITADGTEVLSIVNTGTGNSFVVEDEAGDGSPFVIAADGNVGVGANPLHKLHVQKDQDSGTGIGIINMDAGSSASSGLFLTTDEGTSYFAMSSDAGSKEAALMTEAENGLVLISQHATVGGIRFATGPSPATERMRIDRNGNIGIGTTDPKSLLHVGGSVILGDGAETCSGGETDFQGAIRYNATSDVIEYCKDNDVAADSWEALVGASGAVTADSLDFTEFKDAMALDASTSITADGTEVLSIVNTGTGNSFVVEDEASVDATPFVIDADGNVGIGTPTPGFLLDAGSAATMRMILNTTVATSDDPYDLGMDTADSNTERRFTLATEEGILRHAMQFGDSLVSTSVFGISSSKDSGATWLPSFVVQGRGNVGVGTNDPKSLLHVAGSVILGDGAETCSGGETDFQGAIRYNATSDVIEYCKDNDVAADSWEALVGASGAVTDDSLDFDKFKDAMALDASTSITADGTEVLSIVNTGTGNSFVVEDEASVDATPFVIDADGNVGIGTAAPQKSLHIYKPGAPAHIQLESAATGFTALNLLTNGDGASELGDATTLGWHVVGRGNAYTNAPQQNDLLFNYWDGTAWDVRMALDSLTGYVGIGRDDPLFMLDIEMPDADGTALRLKSDGTAETGIGIAFNSVGAGLAQIDAYRAVGSTAHASLRFETRSSTTMAERMRIHENGFVGIGNTDPKTMLHVGGSVILGDGAETCSGGETDFQGAIRYNATTDAIEYCKDNDTSDDSWEALASGGSGLWTDNTTYISRDGFHVIDTAETTLPGVLDDNGTYSFYFPNKGAFRGGEVSSFNDAWNNGNIGQNSFGYGENTQAEGENSAALGNYSTASGQYSMAFGSFTTASAQYSTAFGREANAIGTNSIAAGRYANASGFASLAFGNQVIAGDNTAQTSGATSGKGNYSVAFGLGESGGSTANYPRVTGNESLALFFGDQTSSNMAQENVLALVGGKLLIDDVDGGSDTNQGCIRYNDTANQMEFTNDCEAGSPTWAALGGASAAGSANEIQFNDGSGGLAASSDFTFNDTSDTLTVNGIINAADRIKIDGQAVTTVLSSNGITADSLDFTEFKDAMALDASTSITADGTEVLSIVNTGTGNSFFVGDKATDDTPFVIDDTGAVGIGTPDPTGKLSIYRDNGNAYLTVESDETSSAGVHLLTSGDGITALDAAGSTGWMIGARGDTYAATPSLQNDLFFNYWDGTTWIRTLSMDSGSGNVGIDVNEPKAILHINGSMILRDGGEDCSTGETDFPGAIRYNATTDTIEFCKDNAASADSWEALASAGAATVADDSLDFDKFDDTMELDASTSITADGTEVLSIVNTGTGNTLLVEDEAGDGSPFVIDAAGNVAIGKTTASTLLDISGASANDVFLATMQNTTAGSEFMQFNNSAGTEVIGLRQHSTGSGLVSVRSAANNSNVTLSGSAGAMRLSNDDFADQSDYYETQATDEDFRLNYYDDSAGTTTSRMIIQPDGRMGVNTTSADSLTFDFTIFDSPDDAGDDANMTIRSAAGGATLYLAAPTSNYSHIIFSGNSNNWAFGKVGSANFRLKDSTNNTIPFQIEPNAPDESFYMDASGEIGLGTDTPGATLDVNGDIQYSGTMTDTSDRRLKTDIVSLNTQDMINRLAQIDTYSFKMKDDEKGRTEFGVMAQELETLFPELVHTADDEMGTKSVNYIGLIAPMIEVSKALKSENDNLKEELAALQDQNSEVLAAINTMKQDVAGLKLHTSYNIQNASFANIGMLILMLICGTFTAVIVLRRTSKNLK